MKRTATRMQQRGSTIRPWVLAFTPVVLLVALIAGVFVAAESLGTPSTQSLRSETLTLGPDPTPTPTSVAVDPTTTPSLPDVEPIEEMPSSGFSPEMLLGQESDGAPTVLADVAYLGTREGHFGQGLLSIEGKVCLWILATEPDATASAGEGKCATWSDFVSSGLSVSSHGWNIRWFADGSVEWSN